MNLPKSNVIKEIVNHDLCIGCGACAAICPTNQIALIWHANIGMPQASFQPVKENCSEHCSACLRVCPFAENSTSAINTASDLFADIEGVHYHAEAGYWLDAYCGFAPNKNIRLSSASGGWVTFFLQQLLVKGIITAAVCVGRSNDSTSKNASLFQYKICHTADEIAACARSAYYPVSMIDILTTINNTPGNYAVVALPCMARALRLLCLKHPILKKRIKYVFGLVCGQIKTAHFSEFLAAKNGFANLQDIVFRVKDKKYPNTNWGIKVVGDAGKEKIMHFSDIDRFWSDRYFTPMSCNVCTDVFAETADATFMDAWLPEFSTFSEGWSLAVIRDKSLLALFKEFSVIYPQAFQQISIDKVLASQEGVLVSKREDVYWRLRKIASKENIKSIISKLNLRKPRWSRRWLSEATYLISNVSSFLWSKHRFNLFKFYGYMLPFSLMVNGARQIWRIHKVMELLGRKFRGRL